MGSEMGCDNIRTASGKTLKETCSSSLPVGGLNPTRAATLAAHSSTTTAASQLQCFLLFCKRQREPRSASRRMNHVDSTVGLKF